MEAAPSAVLSSEGHMGEIINHDFGKEDREHARRLAGLLQLLKERDEDLLANPGKYFAIASDRIAEQERLLRALSDAIKIPWSVSSQSITNEPPNFMPPDIVRIDRRDYEALRAVKTLIHEWDRRF